MFTNSPWNRFSIPWSSHRKVSKMLLDAFLLYTHHYKARIEGEWRNPGKGVAPSPTLQCCWYWKGNLPVILNCGKPSILHLLNIFACSNAFILSFILLGLVWVYHGYVNVVPCFVGTRLNIIFNINLTNILLRRAHAYNCSFVPSFNGIASIFGYLMSKYCVLVSELL